jgi:hypothetical protein
MSAKSTLKRPIKPSEKAQTVSTKPARVTW